MPCSCKTKNGTPCQNPVKLGNKRCSKHKACREAIVDGSQDLVCKRCSCRTAQGDLCARCVKSDEAFCRSHANCGGTVEPELPAPSVRKTSLKNQCNRCQCKTKENIPCKRCSGAHEYCSVHSNCQNPIATSSSAMTGESKMTSAEIEAEVQELKEKIDRNNEEMHKIREQKEEENRKLQEQRQKQEDEKQAVMQKEAELKEQRSLLAKKAADLEEEANKQRQNLASKAAELNEQRTKLEQEQRSREFFQEQQKIQAKKERIAEESESQESKAVEATAEFLPQSGVVETYDDLSQMNAKSLVALHQKIFQFAKTMRTDVNNQILFADTPRLLMEQIVHLAQWGGNSDFVAIEKIQEYMYERMENKNLQTNLLPPNVKKFIDDNLTTYVRDPVADKRTLCFDIFDNENAYIVHVMGLKHERGVDKVHDMVTKDITDTNAYFQTGQFGCIKLAKTVAFDVGMDYERFLYADGILVGDRTELEPLERAFNSRVRPMDDLEFKNVAAGKIEFLYDMSRNIDKSTTTRGFLRLVKSFKIQCYFTNPPAKTLLNDNVDLTCTPTKYEFTQNRHDESADGRMHANARFDVDFKSEYAFYFASGKIIYGVLPGGAKIYLQPTLQDTFQSPYILISRIENDFSTEKETWNDFTVTFKNFRYSGFKMTVVEEKKGEYIIAEFEIGKKEDLLK